MLRAVELFSCMLLLFFLSRFSRDLFNTLTLTSNRCVVARTDWRQMSAEAIERSEATMKAEAEADADASKSSGPASESSSEVKMVDVEPDEEQLRAPLLGNDHCDAGLK